MKVKDIMLKPEIIGPEASMKEACCLMKTLGVDSLLVIKDRKLVGIITKSDVVRKLVPTDRVPSTVKVKEIMTLKVISLEEDENVDFAAATMAKNGFSHIPITSRGRIVGMLTDEQILKNAPEIGMETLF